jgi:hypothetical protein
MRTYRGLATWCVLPLVATSPAPTGFNTQAPLPRGGAGLSLIRTTCALGYARNISDLEFGKRPTMIDRDVWELLIGFSAILIFGVVLVWLQQVPG